MSSGFKRIRPTKPNLDKLKNRKKFAEKGDHLLEMKRIQILDRFKENFNLCLKQRNITREKIKQAYAKLNKAYMHYGKRRIKILAELNRIHYEPSISINFVSNMGIDTPKVKLDLFEKEKLPSYSFQDTPIDFDDTVDFIKELLNDIIKVAELDYVIFHLAFNYQKIQRRIKALEDLLIPHLSSDIKGIEEILEDLEREELIRMRKIKDNLEKSN
ncbi:MAG: V-type ATP synthase subunit D [Promethearchaeota archaeon]